MLKTTWLLTDSIRMASCHLFYSQERDYQGSFICQTQGWSAWSSSFWWSNAVKIMVRIFFFMCPNIPMGETLLFFVCFCWLHTTSAILLLHLCHCPQQSINKNTRYCFINSKQFSLDKQKLFCKPNQFVYALNFWEKHYRHTLKYFNRIKVPAN